MTTILRCCSLINIKLVQSLHDVVLLYLDIKFLDELPASGLFKILTIGVKILWKWVICVDKSHMFFDCI